MNAAEQWRSNWVIAARMLWVPTLLIWAAILYCVLWVLFVGPAAVFTDAALFGVEIYKIQTVVMAAIGVAVWGILAWRKPAYAAAQTRILGAARRLSLGLTGLEWCALSVGFYAQSPTSLFGALGGAGWC
ncbi:hypothetical protein [Ottowia sp.]|uniref:hypothetical protein n=1 Tax=Ottowia sp. TaxID=1898956 RepID=UPI003A8B3BD3